MATEHSHEHTNIERGHSHHYRSAWRNKLLFIAELPLAIYSGSFALKVAVGHNGVDGSIHKLRDRASSEQNDRRRAMLRLKAAGLLAGAGVASYALERMSGVHTDVPIWVGWVFAGETVVNVVGLADGIKNGEEGTDTLTSKLHNGTDAIISAATAATILIPTYLGNENTQRLDNIAAYGHLGFMSLVAGITAATAFKD